MLRCFSPYQSLYEETRFRGISYLSSLTVKVYSILININSWVEKNAVSIFTHAHSHIYMYVCVREGETIVIFYRSPTFQRDAAFLECLNWSVIWWKISFREGYRVNINVWNVRFAVLGIRNFSVCIYSVSILTISLYSKFFSPLITFLCYSLLKNG